jgi:hypothetical protein
LNTSPHRRLDTEKFDAELCYEVSVHSLTLARPHGGRDTCEPLSFCQPGDAAGRIVSPRVQGVEGRVQRYRWLKCLNLKGGVGPARTRHCDK